MGRRELTWVRACPSFSCGPLRVMVLLSDSGEGISTHTPVVWRISWRTRPRGPTMYLCWLLRTSTDTEDTVRFCMAVESACNLCITAMVVSQG